MRLGHLLLGQGLEANFEVSIGWMLSEEQRKGLCWLSLVYEANETLFIC